MKPLMTLTLCLMCCFPKYMCAKDIYSAIAEVESNNNDFAYNAKEDAAGRYQIRMIYLEDVNRINKTHYTSDDRFDPVKSLEMVRIYTTHYASVYSKRTGNPITDEVIARIHNGGGYRGALKASTEKYWKKVKKALDKQ